MKAFWDERYADEEYAYGTAPNQFFKEQLDKLSVKGVALFPAEGEGRNAVYAAQKGWQVDAFDISEEGRKKAMVLAEKNQVTIHYSIITGNVPELPTNRYDLIVLIYAHFPPEVRKEMHAQLLKALKPGGKIILEAFHKENLQYVAANPKVGGPKNEAMLMDETTLREEFQGLQFKLLNKQEVNLNEGAYHAGKGCIVRMVGGKVLY